MAPIFLSKLSGLLEDECDGCVEEQEVVSSADDDVTEATAVDVYKKTALNKSIVQAGSNLQFHTEDHSGEGVITVWE